MIPLCSTANKTVLITGAAGGIGFELAKLFASEGYDLILWDKDGSALEAAVLKLGRSAAQEIHSLCVDLSDRGEVERAALELRNSRNIDVLVNNAGFGISGPVWKADVKRGCTLLDVNLTVPVLLIGIFLPGMIERDSGGIINMCSVAAFGASGENTLYYASKAGLLVVTEGLSMSLRESGAKVTATAVCPGPTQGTRFNWTTAATASPPRYGLHADTVARAAYDGFVQGKRMVIPGFRFLLLYWLSRLLPRSLVLEILRRSQRQA